MWGEVRKCSFLRGEGGRSSNKCVEVAMNVR